MTQLRLTQRTASAGTVTVACADVDVQCQKRNRGGFMAAALPNCQLPALRQLLDDYDYVIGRKHCSQL
jgi:hypothetical protein